MRQTSEELKVTHSTCPYSPEAHPLVCPHPSSWGAPHLPHFPHLTHQQLALPLPPRPILSLSTAHPGPSSLPLFWVTPWAPPLLPSFTSCSNNPICSPLLGFSIHRARHATPLLQTSPFKTGGINLGCKDRLWLEPRGP